jgi:nitroreductase
MGKNGLLKGGIIMEDFKELVLKRQSCRKYDGRTVDKDDIVKCLDAARLAPSACNSQPWHFVVVTDEKTREKLSKLVQIIGGNMFADKAPVLIAVYEEECPKLMPQVLEKWGCKYFAQGDIGIAVAYLTLQAAEIGLSTCIMGTFEDSDVKSLLNIPPAQTVRVIIALGHAEDKNIRAKNRKSIEEIANFIE